MKIDSQLMGDNFVYKIVRFFRNSAFIKIGLGIFVVVLYFANQKMLAVWLAHIFMVVYFMPVTYELTGSLNLAFCCNPLLISPKDNGFRKKVKLNSWGKKLFCGYDDQDNMLWLILFYQCLLLAYICVFVFLNLIFIIALVTSNVNTENWMRLWIFEINVQSSIVVVVMIFFYIEQIYLLLKGRKKHSKNSVVSIIKSDIKISKSRKIIKQKNEIVAFLKQYGLHTDKHKHYVIESNNLAQVEKALSGKFPESYIIFSKNEKEKHFFKVYNEDDALLIQMEIK